MVDGCRRKLVNVGSDAGQCFGPVIVLPVLLRAVLLLENKLIGYADDSTLMVVMPSTGV